MPDRPDELRDALLVMAAAVDRAVERIEPPRDAGEQAALQGIATAYDQLARHFEYLAERGIILRSPPSRGRPPGH